MVFRVQRLRPALVFWEDAQKYYSTTTIIYFQPSVRPSRPQRVAPTWRPPGDIGGASCPSRSASHRSSQAGSRRRRPARHAQASSPPLIRRRPPSLPRYSRGSLLPASRPSIRPLGSGLQFPSVRPRVPWPAFPSGVPCIFFSFSVSPNP